MTSKSSNNIVTTNEKYGFSGRLTSKFPSQIIVDCTEVCNLACIHCPHPEFIKSDYYNARYLEKALNEKMVDEVRLHGRGSTQYIRYTSEGEPLIHPQGYEMIEYATLHSGVFVTLTTNGTIMDEKRTQSILDANLHMIDISLDAYTPETYAKIRVNGDLNVTRNNVKRLLKWVRESGSKTKVIVSFVEQPYNLHEVDDFVLFWNDQGADNVIIRKLHSSAGSKKEIAKDLKKNKILKRRPCLYPWERIILNPRGFLAFCPQDWIRGSEIINYRRATILDTWQSIFYKNLRNAHLNNNYSCHSFCGNCPDWGLTNWPGKGRSYADIIEEFINDGD